MGLTDRATSISSSSSSDSRVRKSAGKKEQTARDHHDAPSSSSEATVSVASSKNADQKCEQKSAEKENQGAESSGKKLTARTCDNDGAPVPPATSSSPKKKTEQPHQAPKSAPLAPLAQQPPPANWKTAVSASASRFISSASDDYVRWRESRKTQLPSILCLRSSPSARVPNNPGGGAVVLYHDRWARDPASRSLGDYGTDWLGDEGCYAGDSRLLPFGVARWLPDPSSTTAGNEKSSTSSATLAPPLPLSPSWPPPEDSSSWGVVPSRLVWQLFPFPFIVLFLCMQKLTLKGRGVNEQT